MIAGLEAARNYKRDAEALKSYLGKTRRMIEGASTQWLNSRATGADMYRRLRLSVEINRDDQMVLSGAFRERYVRLSKNTHLTTSPDDKTP